eukprot:CAMPEP_0119423020 /NCGR_PEP_ID=MMETSP1335-20130426/29384_1 /TAXON_ID=259385 /ORGANISM="Chrysoculter rhomboideus, Strain RCC1486" /LENGTH=281 /DNA_ID=CAMNT_0007448493 /DNA_START=1 /DNA_END=846 /DNA_ORIENTATION=+
MIMLFMAITSTGSAECIAVSSIVAYDIYYTYINPKATGDRILLISRVVIGVFGATMGVLAILLNAIGLNLGWVYLFMGIMIGSGVIPMALCLTWSKTNGTAATASCIIGTVLALISWIIAASIQSGEVTVASLGKNEPMLTGNLFAIFSSAIITVLGSVFFPENYDFESMKAIPVVEQEEYMPDEDETPEKLMEAREWIQKWGWVVSLILIVLWPLATVPWGVFPKAVFALWSSIAVMWGFLATVVIIFLPIIESGNDIVAIFANLFGLGGKGTYQTTSKA